MFGIIELVSIAAIFASIGVVMYNIRLELRTKTIN